jgi:hypothetical protein
MMYNSVDCGGENPCDKPSRRITRAAPGELCGRGDRSVAGDEGHPDALDPRATSSARTLLRENALAACGAFEAGDHREVRESVAVHDSPDFESGPVEGGSSNARIGVGYVGPRRDQFGRPLIALLRPLLPRTETYEVRCTHHRPWGLGRPSVGRRGCRRHRLLRPSVMILALRAGY